MVIKKRDRIYCQLYLDLRESIIDIGVFVYDTDIQSPGAAVDLRYGGPRRFIIICGKRSWRDRLFILLHEIGHMFKYSGGNLIPLARMNASERRANLTAVKILDDLRKTFKINLLKSYAAFYNSMNKNSRRAKFFID